MHAEALTLAQAAPAGMVLDLLKLLAAAALVTTVLHRLRLATIPGYLIAGALIGPHALGFVGDPDSVQTIGRLAIILLMFSVGLSLDLGAMRGGVRAILLVGVISTAASALVCWPIAVIFGLSPSAALAVAMAMTMSSTAISLRVLQARRELNRVPGRLAVGVSLVQDLLSVAVLALLPALALWSASGQAALAADGPSLWQRVWEMVWRGVVALGGVTVLVAFGRLVLPRLMQTAAGVAGEVLLVLTAAVALGAAVATAALGFTPELGAFLAGFVLATTPFRYQIAGQLDPMRDLFMAVFFCAIGLTMDPDVLLSGCWIILLALLVLFVVKGGIIGLSCWAVGATPAASLAAALLLAQAGEFGLVVVAATANVGLIDAAVQSKLIALIVLSLIVTPFVYDAGKRVHGPVSRLPLAPWLSRRAPAALREQEPEPEPGEAGESEDPRAGRHVIVAGFGVCGRAVVDLLEQAGVPCVVVELNVATVRKQARMGRSIIYGDVTNPEVLRSAGISTADAIVLTIPDDDATLRACRLARSMAPSAFIAVRSSYMSKGMVAESLGADLVVVEEVATAETMQERVVERVKARRSPPAPTDAAPAS
ncbi:MAG TPA: cation:proton antiporter [Phycisphaerales bacterium]|nr:cation:proton antiporter [Phycisphaerales bacterium]